MSEYFPKPKSLGANVKVELDVSNYATKSDLQNTAGVDTSDFAKKTEYNELDKNVNVIDTSRLVKKTNYNVKIKDIEDICCFYIC